MSIKNFLFVTMIIISVNICNTNAIQFDDNEKLSKEDQQKYFTSLEGTKPSKLQLENYTFLKDNDLNRFTLENLTECNLGRCEDVTNKSILYLSSIALNLRILNISNNKKLYKIGDLGYIKNSHLQFKELRFLDLHMCTNLDQILIKAPKLYCLIVANCTKLSSLALDEVIKESKNLTKIFVSGCLQIDETEKSLRRRFPNYPSTYWKNNISKTAFPVIKDFILGTTSEAKISNEIQTIPEKDRLIIIRKILDKRMNLTNLDFTSANLSNTELRMILSGSVPHLTCLNLTDNAIDDDVAPLIKSLSSLRELELTRTNMGVFGSTILVQNTNLKFLNLQETNLKSTEIASIVANWDRLEIFPEEEIENYIFSKHAQKIIEGIPQNSKIFNKNLVVHYYIPQKQCVFILRKNNVIQRLILFTYNE